MRCLLPWGLPKTSQLATALKQLHGSACCLWCSALPFGDWPEHKDPDVVLLADSSLQLFTV